MIATTTISPQLTIPRLENGDKLTRREFERRYKAMPNLIFASKAGAYLLHSWVGSCLIYKHLTRLERLATEKQLSSLQKIARHKQKSFITFTPGTNVI